MGSGHQILLMIFMIIIVVFLTISLQGSTHILIFTDGSSLGSKAHGLQELHLMEDSNNGVPERVQKVSGEDESEKKEALILQKFRALLGLQRFKAKRTPRDDSQSLSPSPSPSVPYEPETPASAPLQRNIHSHSHPSQPRTRPGPPHHKIQKQETDSGRVRRILVPVLLSAGAAFVACVLGFMCACGKFRKLRKKSAGTMSVHSKKSKAKCKSKYTKSQSSTRNVSLNPTLDLFYLNSSGVDLEQQGSCLNQTSEAIKASPDHQRKESNQEVLMKSESDNASSSSTREIMSFHEDAGSVRYESDGGDSLSCDKIVPLECHSSEDESFHSFGDSHSSNLRLSNASAASLSDAAENCPRSLPSSTNLAMLQAKPDNVSTLAPLSPDKSEVVNSTMSGSLDCDQKFIPAPPTPPPPPPPPPPSKRVSLSHSSSCSSRITSKASSPASLPNLSSPKFLDSSSGSKQGLLGDLPGSSIPPPPCPPPFLKGKGNSFKGPPPSPCQLPQYTPMGKDGAPLPKLKPLHWDKVRAAPDRSMVWDKLRSSSFELDEEMMESLFGYNIQSSMKNDETKSKSPSPSKHVLEPKRLQNITILSKALSATAEQVCNALMKGEGLCLQQLEALVKMVPTKEEEAKLSGYKGDINELGSAEKFVKAMLSIPFAFLRVEAMLYKETFEDEVFHLRNSFSMLEEACKELRSSRLFLKLLEAVLKTGNRMNVGTIRGGAQAFKLDALLKLADVKGTDGKTTLLHFVVQEIIRSEGIRVSDSIMGKINKRSRSKTVEEREEDYRRMGLDLVSGLTTELYNVKKTATIDLDVLASSVSNLSDGMAKLQNLVHQDLSTNPTSGSFIHTMNSFMNYAEKNLKELQEDEDRVLLHVREITEYFHGEVGKDEVNPLRIFVIVRDFLGMLDHVCKELRSLKVPSSPSPLAPFR